MNDQTPFCWICGHVEAGHDHYNTVVVHDPHTFLPSSAMGAYLATPLNERQSSSYNPELALSRLRDAARDFLEEVEGWPNGPAQESKRIPYDAAFRRLEALVRPSLTSGGMVVPVRVTDPTAEPTREQRLEGILRQILHTYYDFDHESDPEGWHTLEGVLSEYIAAADSFLATGVPFRVSPEY